MSSMRSSTFTWVALALAALVVAAGVTFAASRIVAQPLGDVSAPRVSDRLAPAREGEGNTSRRPPARTSRPSPTPTTPAATTPGPTTPAPTTGSPDGDGDDGGGRGAPGGDD
jgi:hypothetical protein